jgi:hypothetical protein
VVGAGLASNVIASPEKSVISIVGILAVALIICGVRLWTSHAGHRETGSRQR